MISGRNQAKIGSESGPGGGVQLGRCQRGRSGWGGPCSSSESLYPKAFPDSSSVLYPFLPLKRASQLGTSGPSTGFFAQEQQTTFLVNLFLTN